MQARLEADLDGMDAMLADALAFVRGTAGRVHTPVDLADIVTAEVAERETRGEPVTIKAELGDAPTIGNAHSLRRVAANLIDNAVKYGRGRVRITVRRQGRLVCLTVEDDGPGISPDQRTAVLEPYRRGDGLRSRHLAGSGLVLAIRGQIVRAHGGNLEIATSELGGAAMIVQLCAQATAMRPGE